MKKKIKTFFTVIFVISLLCNILFGGYILFDYYKNKRNKVFRLNAYSWDNNRLGVPEEGEKRVVFIGNSITENWGIMRPEFFKDNRYIARGISGQTSPLILLRFRHDVVDLKPKAVVINAGTNDIAENTGEYDAIFTMNNIKSMAQLAQINGIKPILVSLLPSNGHGWKGHITHIPEKIQALNEEIKAYADENGFAYVDYYPHMVNEYGGMNYGYTYDGLHPNVEGYKVMEPLIQKAINEVLNQKDVDVEEKSIDLKTETE